MIIAVDSDVKHQTKNKNRSCKKITLSDSICVVDLASSKNNDCLWRRGHLNKQYGCCDTHATYTCMINSLIKPISKNGRNYDYSF